MFKSKFVARHIVNASQDDDDDDEYWWKRTELIKIQRLIFCCMPHGVDDISIQFRNGWLNTHQWKTRFSFGQNQRRISNRRNNRIFLCRCRCHCVDWPAYINLMTLLAYIWSVQFYAFLFEIIHTKWEFGQKGHKNGWKWMEINKLTDNSRATGWVAQ